ncbi:MAG: sugar ABC transporter ATP-binding protein [Phycisphaerae bacterium]|nr:sugar ABC transporter ATP-binding protein [Phycisphaerae bacterium]
MNQTDPTSSPDPGSGVADAAPDLLVVRHVSKRFGPTQALDDVSVTFRAGEVHALMGENGAGKSTLGKAIAGLHKPDTGEIVIAGTPLRSGSLHEAFLAGVRIVHQELAQCPNLSVAENLCLHDLPRNAFGLVCARSMRRRARRLLEKLDPGIDPDSPLGSLPPGRRQIVQIAAALDERESGGGGGNGGGAQPRIIVFDEPTSSLSVAEADRLLAIIRQLATEGLTCIYVSHRMGEIFQVCDRVTVLRDGRFVATSDLKDIDESTLVSQMIGRTLAPHVKESAALAALAGDGVSPDGATHAAAAAPPALEVRALTSPGKLDNVSIEVRPGEVLGVGGLVGSGRSELLDAIFGLDPLARGSVRAGGVSIDRAGPRGAIRAGVGYVPEDRRLQGLFFQLGIDENIVMPLMPFLARFGIRDGRAERALVRERADRLRVKAASFRSLPGELSGGNQQKLLIARWMDRKTRILLLDEPTRGIDIGTKTEIYRLVREAARDGAAVLLVSSEMPELLALSDRIVVLCEGRLTGELTGERMTQENILRLATQSSAVKAG